MTMIPIVLALVAASIVVFAAAVRMRKKRKFRRSQTTLEDALKHLYHSQERKAPVTSESLAGAVAITMDEAATVLQRLIEQRLVEVAEGRLQLTDAGAAEALRIIRSHRLWERYLADETGVDERRWHAEAERREHQLSTQEVDALAKRLGQPLYDPHGDPIPPVIGAMPEPRGISLQTASPGSTLMVVHVEDEPQAVYSELVACGFHPGVRVKVVERDDKSVSVAVAGTSVRLTYPAAANVTVVFVPAKAAVAEERTLDRLPIGRRARVRSIAETCRGLQRRRLLDLGFVPGTTVAAELANPGGDPVAYRIRGGLVALRQQQAMHIILEDDMGKRS